MSIQKVIILLCTGKSMSEALIFESTNPQYDNRLFIELPEGVSSTMILLLLFQNSYLKMWNFFAIWCGKRFAISIGQIQSKLIYGLVTYVPNGL